MIFFDQSFVCCGVRFDVAVHRGEIEPRAVGCACEMIALVPSRYFPAPNEFRNFAYEWKTAAFFTRIDAQAREPMYVRLMSVDFLGSRIQRDRIGSRKPERHAEIFGDSRSVTKQVRTK